MKVITFLLIFFIFLILLPVGKLKFNDMVSQKVLPEQINNDWVDNEEYPESNWIGQTYFINVNAGQRFTNNDPEVIEQRIGQISESEGFNIVVLGDSIIYGDGTIDENKTIPSLLRKKLKETQKGQIINVYNFTLPSAAPAEVYLITRELVKAKVDLFIYDINIGWLDREKILEHPVLLKLGDNKNLNPDDFQVYNLDEATPNYYNLYDLDENLMDLATPWTQKNWEGILDSEGMGNFGRIHLEWSEQWKYVQKTVSLLQEHNIDSLFFANPRNFELLDKYDLIDYQSYYKTIETIFNYLQNAEVMTLNLDSAVPSKYFSDLVHLLPEGEEIISNRLYDFIIQSGLLDSDC